MSPAAKNAALDLGRWLGRIHDLDSHLQIPMRRYPEILGRSGQRIYDQFKARSAGTEIEAILDPDGDEVVATPESIWKTKGPLAPGAGSVDGRLAVLDMMGIDRQLVFPQVMVCWPAWGQGDDALATMRDYNDFCAQWVREARGRLRPVGLLNMRDLDVACAEAERSIANGVRAFLFPDGSPPGGLSPADPALDRLWALLAESNACGLLHVGGHVGYTRHHTWGQTELLSSGGAGAGESVTPHMLVTLHQAPENYLAAMVMGGVFERHETLRFGCIEQGASWVGPMAVRMDTTFEMGLAKKAREACSLMPSEYLQRNFRATPFVTEDIGAMIERFGLDEIYCFSTDFPHPEGGRDPLQRMTASVAPHGEAVLERFLVGNAELLVPE
ncbi:MAG: amidohydrolase family protein [Myxococcales bacterium]|nr:amidohydrolase family protein [Myxococcales bacterium]